MSIENENRLSPEKTGDQSIKTDAAAKIADELKHFHGGNKEKAVSTHVASLLTHFCEQDERFAKAVIFTTRTLSECCAEIMSGVGNSISDIDVYRSAVKHYFPNSEVNMVMQIEITGDEPTTEDLTRKPTKKPQKSNAPKKAAERKVEAPVTPPPPPEPETMQLSMF